MAKPFMKQKVKVPSEMFGVPLTLVDKWYAKFLSAMKKRHGDHWQQKVELSPEVAESILVIHQQALLMSIKSRQSKNKEIT